jgi:hypothetical protein
MTKFRGGPLDGYVLELSRSPLYLRACVGPGGKHDALDQLNDTPAADERLTVYRRNGKASHIHIDYTDRATGRRRGRNIAYAEYIVLPDDEQPPEEVMRDTAAWREWAEARAREGEHDTRVP